MPARRPDWPGFPVRRRRGSFPRSLGGCGGVDLCCGRDVGRQNPAGFRVFLGRITGQDDKGGQAVYRYLGFAVLYCRFVDFQLTLQTVGDGQSFAVVLAGNGECDGHGFPEAIIQRHIINGDYPALLLPLADLVAIATSPAVMQAILRHR